jgi:hypothetical protein
MCLEGATLAITDGQFDNANLTQNTTMKKAFGSAVATSAVAACITLG